MATLGITAKEVMTKLNDEGRISTRKDALKIVMESAKYGSFSNKVPTSAYLEDEGFTIYAASGDTVAKVSWTTAKKDSQAAKALDMAEAYRDSVAKYLEEKIREGAEKGTAQVVCEVQAYETSWVSQLLRQAGFSATIKTGGTTTNVSDLWLYKCSVTISLIDSLRV